MFYQLPPAGHRISLSRAKSPGLILEEAFSPYKPYFYASGTASLAAAVLAAKNQKSSSRPEVLLPAYACPDLVSAVLCAGAIPILVDLEAGRPWMDLEQLAAKITSNAIAIIAVDLFGISERGDQIKELASEAGIFSIQDSAQLFPERSKTNVWWGDAVIVSFGRGKPISLLGGGAVLCRNLSLAKSLPVMNSSQKMTRFQALQFKLKAIAYNALISAYVYWIPNKLPFLHLGETRFEALEGIAGMDQSQFTVLPLNIMAYWNRQSIAQKLISEMLGNLGGQGIVDLPACCAGSGLPRLLRYPILVPPRLREGLYNNLHREGLGVSKMYPAPLSEIPDLEMLLSSQGPFPGAEDFAMRILTLPTHVQVGERHIYKIGRILRQSKWFT